MSRAARIVAAVIAVVMLGACGGQETVAPPTGDTRASAPAAGSETGETLPAGTFDFTADAVGEGQIEGGEFAGRDVAVWFWAPW